MSTVGVRGGEDTGGDYMFQNGRQNENSEIYIRTNGKK